MWTLEAPYIQYAVEPGVVGRGGLGLGFLDPLDFHPEHLRSPRPPDASNLLVLTFSLDRSLISVYDTDKPFTVQSLLMSFRESSPQIPFK